jgi:hypothetical protein
MGQSKEVIETFQNEKIDEMEQVYALLFWLFVGCLHIVSKYNAKTKSRQVMMFAEHDLRDLGITKRGDLYRCLQDLERRKKQQELCA